MEALATIRKRDIIAENCARTTGELIHSFSPMGTSPFAKEKAEKMRTRKK
jgi:hypothetical protein